MLHETFHLHFKKDTLLYSCVDFILPLVEFYYNALVTVCQNPATGFTHHGGPVAGMGARLLFCFGYQAALTAGLDRAEAISSLPWTATVNIVKKAHETSCA
ncbi:MAG: hypothetical protein ACUVSS_06690 [Anaerolineae bacterium]